MNMDAPHLVFYRVDTSTLEEPADRVRLEVPDLKMTTDVWLSALTHFGNPAHKRHEHPSSWPEPLMEPHFSLWRAKDPVEIDRVLYVADQFNPNRRIELTALVGLLAPAAKSEEGGDKLEIPEGVDHFALFAAAGESVGDRVWVQDQFDSPPKEASTQVLRPRFFAMSAHKVLENGTRFGAAGSLEAIILYETPPRRIEQTRRIKDQFVEGPANFEERVFLGTPTRIVDGA